MNFSKAYVEFRSLRRAAYTEHFRSVLLACFGLSALLLVQVVGCGTSNSIENEGGATAIINQPLDQSVPMGLAATYFVSATGNSLHYQWYKNGMQISGATSTSYTTPPTSFSDTGSEFAVIVSNATSQVESNNAGLTVTARAPAPGDLRFQQVDAESTVNGYSDGPVGVSSGIPGRGSAFFGYSIGSPLYMSPIVCGQPPVPAGAGCEWPFDQFFLPGSLDELGLSTGYGADFISNYPADLYSNQFPAGGSPIVSPNSVVTSLDLETPDDLFAVSWIQSSQSSGFDLSIQTVSASDFQAAANQEGAHSRVITAVSYNAGQVVYFSYGWQSDTSTIYETQVETASIETAESAAAYLASQGYIITAIGGSNLNDNYLLVGTRVQGDTMSRPFLANGANIYTGGYALVGVLQDAEGNATYLGER